MTKGIDKSSLSDRIKDALVAQITEGALKPGDRLVELKIAEQMQTSQAPVREALRELDALGLIEMRRNRGSIVRGIDTKERRDIYAVRAELEGLAAGIAAQTNPELGRKLLDINAKMAESVTRGLTAEFVAANDQFHRSIVESSDNSVLVAIWNQLDIRARTAINVVRRAGELSQAVAEHHAIAEAIGTGDTENAVLLIKKHITHAAMGGA